MIISRFSPLLKAEVKGSDWIHSFLDSGSMLRERLVVTGEPTLSALGRNAGHVLTLLLVVSLCTLTKRVDCQCSLHSNRVSSFSASQG